MDGDGVVGQADARVDGEPVREEGRSGHDVVPCVLAGNQRSPEDHAILIGRSGAGGNRGRSAVRTHDDARVAHRADVLAVRVPDRTIGVELGRHHVVPGLGVVRVRQPDPDLAGAREAPQVLDPVHDVGPGQPQVDGHARPLVEPGVDRGLPAPVVDAAQIALGDPAEAEAGRKGHGQERILVLLVEVGEFRGYPVVQQRDVEPDLELRAALGTHGRVARIGGVEGRRPASSGNDAVLVGSGEGVRLPAGLAPRPAQTERVDHVEVPEALLGHDPGGRDLGIGLRLELGAKGGVVVEADRTGQEQPVVVAELFLHVEADRLVLDVVEVEVGARGRSLVDRAREGRGEPPSGGAEHGEALEVVLRPHGGRGAPGVGQGPPGGGGPVRREVGGDRPLQNDQPGGGLLVDRRQLHLEGPEHVVLVPALVQADHDP